MGTKEDIPEISKDQYDEMMSGDPDDIIQTRMPEEGLFPKVHSVPKIHTNGEFVKKYINRHLNKILFLFSYFPSKNI